MEEILYRVFKRWRCQHCFERFTFENDRNAHQDNIPHTFKCQHCDRKFITKEKQDEHQKSHKGKNN